MITHCCPSCALFLVLNRHCTILFAQRETLLYLKTESEEALRCNSLPRRELRFASLEFLPILLFQP